MKFKAIALIWLPAMSPPARGAWIEICTDSICIPPLWSPPARGAWIEMARLTARYAGLTVAPRTGGVD